MIEYHHNIRVSRIQTNGRQARCASRWRPVSAGGEQRWRAACDFAARHARRGSTTCDWWRRSVRPWRPAQGPARGVSSAAQRSARAFGWALDRTSVAARPPLPDAGQYGRQALPAGECRGAAPGRGGDIGARRLSRRRWAQHSPGAELVCVILVARIGRQLSGPPQRCRLAQSRHHSLLREQLQQVKQAGADGLSGHRRPTGMNDLGRAHR